MRWTEHNCEDPGTCSKTELQRQRRRGWVGERQTDRPWADVIAEHTTINRGIHLQQREGEMARGER